MLEGVLHGVQVLFYLVTGAVLVLTYLNARKSILNPVHTEYQKLVIDRLKEISDDLQSEFDRTSPNYWSTQEPVKEAVEIVNGMFRESREAILASGKAGEFSPEFSDERRIDYLLESIKSDPFIPQRIRDRIVQFLDRRLSTLREVHWQVMQQYQQELAEGKHLQDLDSNWSWVDNLMMKELRARGLGVSEVEAEINRIRTEIQGYFESFDPTT